MSVTDIQNSLLKYKKPLVLFVAIANMVRGSQRVSNVSCGLVSHFTDS